MSQRVNWRYSTLVYAVAAHICQIDVTSIGTNIVRNVTSKPFVIFVKIISIPEELLSETTVGCTAS